MERRGSERLPLSCRVLFDITGTVADAQTRNISSGGFYCLCEERLPVDRRVRCRIHVFRNEAANQNGGVLECLVRIVRVDRRRKTVSALPARSKTIFSSAVRAFGRQRDTQGVRSSLNSRVISASGLRAFEKLKTDRSRTALETHGECRAATVTSGFGPFQCSGERPGNSRRFSRFTSRSGLFGCRIAP